jgi:predicted dithiol-disulfide oxidoreductase (DUF899 family)
MAAVKKVNHDDWLEARIALLKKEKEFTKLRDAMTKMQRELPWERVEKDYVFDGPNGKESLAELFGSCSQLLVYHFMFDPSWDEGCKSCSFLADHYNPATAHLAQRDVVMVTISRAPLEKLEAFKSRMGWNFKWVSSFENDFNRDFHVTFTDEELESGSAYYNYRGGAKFPANEGPGLSVFAKDDKGDVFHTYSSYGRGLDMFITAYNFLDIVPKGRDEAGLSYSMEWIRHHDRYDDASFVDPYLPD